MHVIFMYECVYVHVCCKNLNVTQKWETQAPDRSFQIGLDLDIKEKKRTTLHST